MKKQKAYRNRDVLTSLALMQLFGLFNTMMFGVGIVLRGFCGTILCIVCVIMYFLLMLWSVFILNTLQPQWFETKFEDEPK